MNERGPNVTPHFSLDAGERKALLDKGMGEKEIEEMLRRKNALLRDSVEEGIRDRALESLQNELDTLNEPDQR